MESIPQFPIWYASVECSCVLIPAGFQCIGRDMPRDLGRASDAGPSGAQELAAAQEKALAAFGPSDVPVISHWVFGSGSLCLFNASRERERARESVDVESEDFPSGVEFSVKDCRKSTSMVAWGGVR